MKSQPYESIENDVEESDECCAGADAVYPLLTDIRSASSEDAEPFDQMTFEELCDRIETRVMRQPEHREILVATLGYCIQRRPLPEIEMFIEGLPEFCYESQNPYCLVQSLEAAGGLACVELDEDGEPVTPQRKEGLTEDEVDDLVFEVDFETTDAGREAYERLAPARRLENLLACQPARSDTYCEVLEFCLTPRTRQEIEKLLAGRDILVEESFSDQPLQPSVFVDKLERAGVLVWSGRWVTSDEGKSYLDGRVSAAPSVA